MENILIIEGLKLAPLADKKALVNSLFVPGGTIDGFYKRDKEKIVIYSLQKREIKSY